jgi:hypothetical protein
VANKQYYLDNKEEVKARSAERYLKIRVRDREKLNAQSAAKYHSNKTNLSFRLRQLVRGAKARSKIQDIPFDLDVEYVRNLWDSQEGRCSVSNIKFDLNPSGTYQNKDAPSLDKIIPSDGYIKGNIRLVTWHVNAAILNHGLETFLDLCRAVTEYNKGHP